MSPRSVLSPEERDLVLREAHQETGGTRIPIRTSSQGATSSSPNPIRGTPPPIGGAGSGGKEDGPPLSPRRFPPSPSRRRRRRTIVVILALLLAMIVLATGKLLSVGSSVLSPDRFILGQLTDLLFRRGALQGEKDNRVNVLLVAIGGEGHRGENLADTIMLASFRPKENDVAILSIPRDLYVKLPDTDVTTRINAVHAYGEHQKRGQGLPLLRKKISEITGQPVHYVARVDFLAFKRIVDEIGGIEINVNEGFYDYWHRINFPEGTEHMNGDRALAYVRARFIEGSEGGDFKRQARIQQVLLAIRKKMLSAQTAFDLRALAGVLDALRDNVATNFTLAEVKRLIELTRSIPDGNIRSAVLTTGSEGLLAGTTEILSGRPASVLRPRIGLEEYREIQAFAADIFAQAGAAPPPEAAGTPNIPESPSPTPSDQPSSEPQGVAQEHPTVELRNGTNVTGLAARVAKTLEQNDFTILAVSNAAIRNRSETIVADRTEGKKPNSLRAVLKALGITTAVKFPEAEKAPADANFVIFLGADVAETFKP